MGFQVKILNSFAWSGLFLLLTSCQSSKQAQHPDSKKIGDFSENSIDVLAVKKVQIQKRLKAFRLELEWLKIRKLIVEAEILSNEAVQSEIELESEFSKFQVLENRFPADEGFITDAKRIEWQARLKVKKAETNRKRAAVRLLHRDMKELEAKLFRNGFHYQLLHPSFGLPADANP